MGRLMAVAPVYISRVSSQGIGQQELTQASMGEITGQATARLGQAIGGLGNTVNQVGEQIQRVNRATTIADRQTRFITETDQLEQEFRNDPDPATAPQRFSERVTKLQGQALDGLGQEDQAELRLRLQRQGLAAIGGVRQGALAKQADSYTASLDAQYATLTRRYAEAGTDAERTAITAQLDETLNSGIARGMTTAKGAEAYRQSLQKTGDSAVILRQIGQNPAAAQAMLADPAKFTGLDPVQREQLTAQAKAAAEERQLAGLQQEARFNPATAAMRAGRLTSPDQVAQIFDKAFIPQESSGNPNAQSDKGAAGIAQIMPDTARGLARQMGLGDWSGYSDDEVRQLLKDRPLQTRAMGIQYFQDNIARFNGNIAPAIAAYHAGPGKEVKRAHEAALEQFGAGYSPQQFLSVLSPRLNDGKKATRDYVSDIYRRMGVSLDQPGFSGMAGFRAGNVVGGELDRQRAESSRLVGEMTRVAGAQADEYAKLYTKGYAPDAAVVAAIEGPLQLAASRGDATAAQKLRSLNEARDIAPVIRDAFGHAPEALEASIAGMRQEMLQPGRATPQLARRLALFEGVASEVATARKDNQIALAERQGAPVTAIDPQARADDPAFRQQLAARGVASDRAHARYNGTQQFLRPEEKTGWKSRFEEMGINERFDLLKAVHESTNPKAFDAFVNEVAGGNKYAGIAGRFMKTNPQLAGDIFRGSALLEQEGVKPRVQELKDALKGTFAGDLYPANVQAELIDASLAVYAAERGRNGSLYDAGDKAGLEKAIERVTGKMARLNGGKVPLPREVTAGQLTDLMDNLKPETLAAFGGAFGQGGAALDARFVGRNARLRPMDIGEGKFRVVLPGAAGDRAVINNDGAPLIIDLTEAIKMQRIAARPQAGGVVPRGVYPWGRVERPSFDVPLPPTGPDQTP
jgi:soluble lytic murein transglycosylase-like protein